MPRAQCAEPPCGVMRNEPGVDDIGRTVGDVAADDSDRMRARLGDSGIGATQIIGRSIAIAVTVTA